VADLNSLIKIDKTLIEPASITCARAFENDSFTHWLIPNPAKRANLRYPFEMYLRMSALNNGSAYYTTSTACEGVIAWTPANAATPILALLEAGYPFLPLRCGWRYFWRDNRSTAMCNKLRKKFAPPNHCYLALLAVDPAHQRQGIASMLLKSLLETLDQDKTPCYLETQNLKNVAMYQNFGFKLVHQTHVTGGDHPLYLMLRQF
jgi:ribosomal protein S18 acetylase RimI-like enzyme